MATVPPGFVPLGCSQGSASRRQRRRIGHLSVGVSTGCDPTSPQPPAENEAYRASATRAVVLSNLSDACSQGVRSAMRTPYRRLSVASWARRALPAQGRTDESRAVADASWSSDQRNRCAALATAPLEILDSLARAAHRPLRLLEGLLAPLPRGTPTASGGTPPHRILAVGLDSHGVTSSPASAYPTP